MKALPKHCLPHHAVLLLVYLSALFLTSRAASLPNLFYMAFNGLVLGLSAAYMRRDFDTDLFRLKRTAANVVRQVLTGLGLGCLLAVVVAGVAMLFEDISLFPRLGIQNVAGFILVQMIVALAEEAYFNYYLYDTLMRLFRGKAVWSMAAAAALFAGVHWAMNGSVKQVVIAFAFRLAALLVRQIFRRDNAFYICAGMHFFYNLMVFFVISI